MARKQYDKKTFEINENLKAICWAEDTSYGFRHLAELEHQHYYTIATAKCTYYNRTWERYTYESVLNRLLENAKRLNAEDAADFKALIESDTGVKKDMAGLGFIAGIAKLGELFTDNKTDSNAWKERMLKAGIPQIDFPDNFESLPEEEKTNRLNSVINVLSQKEV